MLILLQRASANVPNPPAGKSTLFVDTNGNFNVLNSNGGYGSFNGSFVAIGNVDLGAVGNIFIADGANGQVLKSFGANGHVYWGDDSATPGGSNTQIQYNDAGSLGGSAGFSFDKVTGALSITGNISAGNVGATTFTGALSGAATTAGTVTTAAQPNITSTGTLVSLTVTGNVAAGNVLTNNLLYANGNAWDLQQPGGSNTQVQYNNDDSFGGSSAFTFNSGTNTLTATNIAGTTLSASGNANVGNLGTVGITATGTIAGGNLTTGGLISATGNVTGANIFTAGQVNANGNIIVQPGAFFIGNGSQLSGIDATAIQNGNSNVQVIANGIVTTSVAGNANIFAVLGTGIQANGTASVSGTVTGGNVSTGGFVTATGNITGANVITAGSVFAPALVANGGAYNTRVTLDTASGIIEANSAGNATQFLPGGQVRLNATAPVIMAGTSDGSQLVLATTQTDLNQLRGGDVTLQVGASGTAVSVLRLQNAGNLVAPAAISAAGNVIGANLTTAGVLSATGNANVGNLGTAGLVVATGNVSGGNLTTAGVLSATGNANVGNLGTAGLVTATGNVSGGNLITGGLVSATGNITSNANVVTDLIAGRTSGITITAAGTNQNINLTPTGSGTVNVGNFIISNVATPLASTDAATKQYVDDVAQGLHTHDSCNAATTTTLATISGGTVTYNNGTSGVGATLTTTGSYTTIDGVTLSDGMRILVKDEVTTANNGIYVRTSSTVLTRADDFNTPAEMAGGDFTFVTAGTVYDNTGWVMPDPVTTVGTSPVVWVQFSGAGTYQAGTGLTLNGSVFNIANTAVTAGAYGNGDYNATFTVNSQGQLSAAANVAITANAANLSGTVLKSTIVTSSLTSVGTLTTLSISGNANIGNVGAAAGVFTSVSGNGSSLSSITGANVTGAVSFATTANAVAGANVSGQVGNALVAGTVYTGAQSNITAVGTLASLSVSGNANVGNIGTAGLIVATGNITGGNLVTAGALSVTGNANVGNIGGGLGVYTTLSASGNVTGGNLVSTGQLGGTGATHLGNTFTTGANTTVGTVTGNFALSAGSRFQATYA
jgi:hypothetical protein